MRLTCDVCKRYDTISFIGYGETSMSYLCGRCNEKRAKKERGVARAKREHYERRQAQAFRNAVPRRVA